jgi:hypothetical protein
MAKMAKLNARVKGSASRGFFRRWKWIWIPVVVFLLIPAMQVAVVRFVDPPRTVPMWIEQVSPNGVKAPLRYRWIPSAQIPEMFLKHLWISEDLRFFQHEGFDCRAGEKGQSVNLDIRGRGSFWNAQDFLRERADVGKGKRKGKGESGLRPRGAYAPAGRKADQDADR